MNRKEHLLTILGEECTEIIQSCAKIGQLCSKANRFGLDNYPPDESRLTTNKEELSLEMTDLFSVYNMLAEKGVLLPLGSYKPKQEKVERMMGVSQKLDLLKEEPEEKSYTILYVKNDRTGLGLSGEHFIMKLTGELKQFDILTYDKKNGAKIEVRECLGQWSEEDVDKGYFWYTFSLLTKDCSHFYPNEKKIGTKLYKY